MQVKALLAVALAAVPTGLTYAKLSVTLTDGAGNVQVVDLDAAEQPTTNPDGSRQFEVDFDDVASGLATVTTQAYDSNGDELGDPKVGTGTVSEPPPGALFPQVTTITVA